VLEITDRAVLALNLMDEAARHGLTIDDRSLARDLGIPVIPTSARSRTGIDALLAAIADVATGAYVCKPHRLHNGPAALRRPLQELTAMLHEAFPGLPNARWVAMRLLDGDRRMMAAVERGELGDLTRLEVETHGGRLAQELEDLPS
jgi:Fe2+ transport system protein B